MDVALQSLKDKSSSRDETEDLFQQGQLIENILRKLQTEATLELRKVIAPDGVIPDVETLRTFSATTHPLVWLATYREAICALNSWAKELYNCGRFLGAEKLIYTIGMSEYVNIIFNGIPMGVVETASLSDIGLSPETIDQYRVLIMAYPLAQPVTYTTRAQLYETIRHFLQDTTQQTVPTWVMGDAGLSPALRNFCRKIRTFLHSQVEPYAHAWHVTDTQIPLDVIEHFAKFGLLDLSTGGGKKSYDQSTVVAILEEIAATSVTLASYVRHHTLATELLHRTATPEQKERWLPRLASGQTLCALTFTEMCSGALMEDLRIRAHLEGSHYRLNGYKTCVSNVARAELLIVLARTPHNARKASFFVLEKSRTTEDDPFPTSSGGIKGLTGSAVYTAGHRGLAHYDLAFDGVNVPAYNLIGGLENHGERQLIQIQEQDCLNAAAQSVGAGRAALEATLRALAEREIFEKDRTMTSREKNKVALMATHLMIARQLCRVTAQSRQGDCRGYIRAGMAKLLASRAAWLCADVALQIQGSAGITLDNVVSRLWVDARTTGLMECPAEFICQRLLEGNPLDDPTL